MFPLLKGLKTQKQVVDNWTIIWAYTLLFKKNRMRASVSSNKTKDWALVQNAALAGGVKVELGLFR